LEGYKKALQKKGINYDPTLVKYCPHNGFLVDEVRVAVEELLSLKEKPDAVVLLADKLTTETLRILKEKKINIPNEMGLIGFSNSDYTSMMNPTRSEEHTS